MCVCVTVSNFSIFAAKLIRHDILNSTARRRDKALRARRNIGKPIRYIELYTQGKDV